MEFYDFQQQFNGPNHIIQTNGFANGMHVTHSGTEYTGDDPLFKKNIGVRTPARCLGLHLPAEIFSSFMGQRHNGVIFWNECT